MHFLQKAYISIVFDEKYPIIAYIILDLKFKYPLIAYIILDLKFKYPLIAYIFLGLKKVQNIFKPDNSLSCGSTYRSRGVGAIGLVLIFATLK